MSLFLYISDSNQFLVMITSVESLKLALHVITDFFFFFFLKVCRVTPPGNLILKHLSSVLFWLLEK